MKVNLRNRCELLLAVPGRLFCSACLIGGILFFPVAAFAQGGVRIIGHTDPIQVFVSVVATNGSPVGGLTSGDFSVNENNQSVTNLVTTVSSAVDTAETFVFAMDYSGSMSASIPNMQAAVLSAITLLDNNDQAAIIKFNASSGVSVVQSLTSNKTLLNAAVSSAYSGSGTNIYDAISTAQELLLSVTGSKAIILLTDGRDNESTTSLANLTAELESGHVPVFTVGLGSLIDNALLEDISDATGGVNHLVTDPAELTGIYEDVSNRIKNEYTLLYSSAITACGPQTLEVTVATTEGDKVYTGTFDRCFPNPLVETPARKVKSGGGSMQAWELGLLAMLLLGSFMAISTTRSNRRQQAA